MTKNTILFGKYLKRIRESQNLTLEDVMKNIGLANDYHWQMSDLEAIELGQMDLANLKIMSLIAQGWQIEYSQLLKEFNHFTYHIAVSKFD
ncbi:hypothetical protein HU830_07195 [Lactobacillus sp. DCY120]|uniref:HTH cro/C1-type domain-containing protein n=1 Tax=Bombilactobacillus apium TaxID=2675299 RepID=A0A850QYL5_9LACO|nr:hypothetical protein [Bombilactobacillus apium]NVY96934.1 hypothetical protein [Bombilactobacillus apium]